MERGHADQSQPLSRGGTGCTVKSCLGGFYFSSLSTVNMPRLGNKKVNFFSSFSINMTARVEGPQIPDRRADHLLWDIEFFLQGASLTFPDWDAGQQRIPPALGTKSRLVPSQERSGNISWIRTTRITAGDEVPGVSSTSSEQPGRQRTTAFAGLCSPHRSL